MKNPKSIFKITTFISLVVLAISLAVLLAIDYSAAQNRDVVSFSGNGVTLKADLYKGTGDYAVIIASEKAQEQHRIRSLVKFFYDSDATVLAYSYENAVSGDGSIDYSAATQAAINTVKEATGFSEDRILLLGYGAGAAPILEYTTHMNTQPMGLVLFAPYGVTNTYTPDTITIPTLILGTTSDDIASPEVITTLYNQLSGDDIRATGFAFKSNLDNVTLRVTSGVFNSYNTYSKQVLTDLSTWLGEALDSPANLSLLAPTVRLYGWLLVVLALIAFFISIYNVSIRTIFHTSYSLVSGKDVLPSAFFILKAVLWLAVIPIAGIIVFFLWLTPLKSFLIVSVFGIYLCVNGLAVYLAYKYIKLPYIDKTNRFIAPHLTMKRFLQAIQLFIFAGAVGVLLSFTGLFGLELTLSRTILFIALTLLSGVGFCFLFFEKLFLDEMKAHFTTKAAFQMISYLPLVAVAVISIPLANFTAALSCIVYLLVFYIAVLIARMIGHLTANPLCASILPAILFSGFLSFSII